MSQFDGLLEIKTDKKTRTKPKTETARKVVTTPPPETRTQPERQLAKSRHNDYIQTSVYIKKETLTMVKRALLIDAQNRDFSDLVEDLIFGWAIKNQ